MFKRISAVFLALSLLLLSSCQKVELKDDVYVFFTSDVHCGVNDNVTMSALSALVKDTRAEHPHVLLCDLGDFSQGEALGSLTKGRAIVEIMNAMHYDIVTIGNHEFDYTIPVLAENMALMDAQIVASNVRYTGSIGNVFQDVPEYVIREFDGVKIAFLGILTPSSVVTSTPKFFMEDGEFVYDFYSGDEGHQLYDKVQSVVDEVRKKGAQYVVALSHLGSNPDDVPIDSVSLIHNTSGIDVVLDGHSHSMIVEDKYPNKEGEDVILSSVGTKMEAVGELIIGKDGSITTMHVDAYDGRDEEVEEVIAAKEKELEDILSRKICSLDYDMMITDEEGIRMSRSRETAVTDFVADAFRYVTGADIALATGGGNGRTNIMAGDVDYSLLMTVTPFQNMVMTSYATGQQIVDALEYGAQNTEGIYKFDGNAVGEFGGFFIGSGLKYTIDTSVETPVSKDDQNVFAGFTGEQRKVRDVMVLENGEYVPIDPDKTYVVASMDYVLINSGDGNTIFKDCEVKEEDIMLDVEAQKQYLEEVGFGDRYRELEGRVVIE